MRVPHMRFTVGRMMIAVAIVATILGVTTGIQRRGENFKRLAAYHLQAADVLMDRAGGPVEVQNHEGMSGFSKSDLEDIFRARGAEKFRASQVAHYHFALYWKYQRAGGR